MARLFGKNLTLPFLGLALFSILQVCWAASSPSPSADSQGTIFIREKAADEGAFQTAFKSLRDEFKSAGFLAYSLHRDLQNPSYLILTLQCSNLEKCAAFLKEENYLSAMKKAGVTNPVLWSGADITPRVYGDLPPQPAGIVIARNDLKSYDYWKAVFDQEHNPTHGGKNPNKEEGYHEKRDYQASHYSIHRGLGPSDVAYVAHEASDISKAPEFMTSAPMKAMKGPLGITKFTVWYGVNLEQGFFTDGSITAQPGSTPTP
jgi:quinol monooxygenase YgiN